MTSWAVGMIPRKKEREGEEEERDTHLSLSLKDQWRWNGERLTAASEKHPQAGGTNDGHLESALAVIGVLMLPACRWFRCRNKTPSLVTSCPSINALRRTHCPFFLSCLLLTRLVNDISSKSLFNAQWSAFYICTRRHRHSMVAHGSTRRERKRVSERALTKIINNREWLDATEIDCVDWLRITLVHWDKLMSIHWRVEERMKYCWAEGWPR